MPPALFQPARAVAFSPARAATGVKVVALEAGGGCIEGQSASYIHGRQPVKAASLLVAQGHVHFPWEHLRFVVWTLDIHSSHVYTLNDGTDGQYEQRLQCVTPIRAQTIPLKFVAARNTGTMPGQLPYRPARNSQPHLPLNRPGLSITVLRPGIGAPWADPHRASAHSLDSSATGSNLELGPTISHTYIEGVEVADHETFTLETVHAVAPPPASLSRVLLSVQHPARAARLSSGRGGGRGVGLPSAASMVSLPVFMSCASDGVYSFCHFLTVIPLPVSAVDTVFINRSRSSSSFPRQGQSRS